jgi:hypothetical protein
VRWRAVWNPKGCFRTSTSSHPFFLQQHLLELLESHIYITTTFEHFKSILTITMDFSIPSGSGTAQVCMPKFGDMKTFLTTLSQQIYRAGNRTILPYSSPPAMKPFARQTRSSSTRQNNTSSPASIHIHCWSTPMEYVKTKANLMLAPDVLSSINAA